MASTMVYHIGMTVVLLSHQVFMKNVPVTDSKAEEISDLEKQLESQRPSHISPREPEPYSIGSWGDTVNGINVGNVIKDVLITLRDHPEIVRKLIADEERSLAEKIMASAAVDELDPPLRDFELPPTQLQQMPKRVVKKMGKLTSGMKRQKETPEETIDMTYLDEGGSEEEGDKDNQKVSKEVKNLIKDTDQLLEGGSNAPSHTDLKRKQDSSEESSEDSQDIEEGDLKSATNKGNYWKNYGKQKHQQKSTDREEKWRMYKNKNKDSEEIKDKGAYWKNYGRNKDKQDKMSKGDFWREYGKNKNKEVKDSDESGWKTSEEQIGSEEQELDQLKSKKSSAM